MANKELGQHPAFSPRPWSTHPKRVSFSSNDEFSFFRGDFFFIRGSLTFTPRFLALVKSIRAALITSGASRGFPAGPRRHLSLSRRRFSSPALFAFEAACAAERKVAAKPPPIARISTRSTRPSMSFNRGSRLSPPTMASKGLPGDSVR